MTLDGGEFLRRFCMHILPLGFMKIRHYGILSSRAKPKLNMQQMKMGVSIVKKEKISWQQITKQLMGFDVEQCPCCKTGKMITVFCFGPNAPQWRISEHKTVNTPQKVEFSINHFTRH